MLRWAALPAWLLAVQTLAAPSPARIFVEPFGNKPGAAELRNETVKLLGKERGVVIVAEASGADFILAGSGETYLRGYLGTNPRVRYLNSDAKPVYGGFLSVELKQRDRQTVWSYLVTPRRFGPDDISHNLAGQIVHRLIEAIEKAIEDQRKGAKP